MNNIAVLYYGGGWRYYNHRLEFSFSTDVTNGHAEVTFARNTAARVLQNDKILFRAQVVGGQVDVFVQLYNGLNSSAATNVITLQETGIANIYLLELPSGIINFNRIKIQFGYSPNMYGYRKVLIDSIYTINGVSIENPYWESPSGIQNNAVDKNFVLYQNYPNPFNPVTKIEYGLPSTEWVTLTVYDITARPVATLVNKMQAAGKHSVAFNATNLPSGTYIYRLQIGNSRFLTKTMVLLK